MTTIIHQDLSFIFGQLDLDEFTRFPEAPDWDREVSLEDRMILEDGGKLHGCYLALKRATFNGMKNYSIKLVYSFYYLIHGTRSIGLFVRNSRPDAARRRG
jgi:hypothetical protein